MMVVDCDDANPQRRAKSYKAQHITTLMSGQFTGLGIKLHDTMNLDASRAYVALSTHIDTATSHNAGDGTYAAQALNFAASVTYHM